MRFIIAVNHLMLFDCFAAVYLAFLPKHAGFIVNLGGATARDVLLLIEEVRKRVFAHAGVLLEPEIRIVGDE